MESESPALFFIPNFDFLFPMPKKSLKKRSLKKSLQDKTKKGTLLIFRERRMGDVVGKIVHPKPIEGYVSTLPGALGWQYKIDPGH